MSDNASRRRLARVGARLAAAAHSLLPPLVLLTDDARLVDPLDAAMHLPKASMVIVRSREAVARKALAERLMPVVRARSLFLMIAGDVALALAVHADGVHLPAARIGEAAAIRARHRLLVTTAAHSFAALRKVAWVDAVLLSPVLATQSHPGRADLGVLRANLMARHSPVPIYALGGITAENAGRLSGFCGIAAIGALAGG
jgi:thiamine-phosphate pyrophosphorylase